MYVFRKSGFKKRQSIKLKDANSRQAILIDANIANDGKILLLHEQRDYTLLPTYLHILSRLDLDTETWEVREDEFRSWFISTFKVNNRFEILKRLEWLSNSYLIEFECVSNELQTVFKQPSKPVQKPKQELLEPTEKATALRATITNQNNKTNVCPPTPLPGYITPDSGDAADPLFEKLSLTLLTKGLDGERTRKTEYKWLREQLVLEGQRGRSRVQNIGNLSEFIGMNPALQKLAHAWILRSPPERMAALFMVASKPGITHELVYALKGIETGYDEYKKLLKKTEKYIAENDFEVEI